MAVLLFELFLFCTIFLLGVVPLRCGWYAKIALGAVLFVGAFKFHVTRVLGGPMFFAPRLPVALLFTLSWLFSILFIFFFFLVAATAGYLLFLLIYFACLRQFPSQFWLIANRLNLGLLVFASALATFGIVCGRSAPEIREMTIVLPNLPAEAEGLTLAVLADIHADKLTPANRVKVMVELTNALRPEVIVLLGDLVDGTVAEHGRDLLPLQELSARYGVFGIPGNHEYYSGYQEWMDFLPTLGIRMLINEHILLPETQVAIAGVTDQAADRFGLDLPDVDRALAGRPQGLTTILLAHRPNLAPLAEQHGVDLQLSGHTHGGMFKGLDYLVARFNGGFVAGWYQVGEMQLYVNRGTGIWNGFPIRIGVPPEITLLRLTKD